MCNPECEIIDLVCPVIPHSFNDWIVLSGSHVNMPVLKSDTFG
jgi:hypothetical protein